jgi:electron transfer flavoprotein alpha/beta subunit
MGGDDAALVTDGALAGADEWATARVLAAALDKLNPDLTLCGMASDDARGSLVPGAIAAMRNQPLLSYASEVMLADGAARIRRLNAAGYDIVEAPLPAVASVTDQIGEPRYASLKGIMGARRKPLETWSLGEIGLSADALRGGALTEVLEARSPEQKPPAERIEGAAADEAAARAESAEAELEAAREELAAAGERADACADQRVGAAFLALVGVGQVAEDRPGPGAHDGARGGAAAHDRARLLGVWVAAGRGSAVRGGGAGRHGHGAGEQKRSLLEHVMSS